MGVVVMPKAARVKRWWPYLVFVIIGAALAACGDGGDHGAPPAGEATATEAVTGTTATAEAPTPEGATSDQTLAQMAVDAVVDDDIVENSVVVRDQPFDVEIVVEDAGPGYQGYQYLLEWDPAVLAYDAAEDFKPGDLTLCATPSPGSGVLYGGCVRASDNTDFAGPLTRITFRCVEQGVSPLHFKPFAEDRKFGTSLLTFRGAVVPTALFDASVSCEGG